MYIERSFYDLQLVYKIKCIYMCMCVCVHIYTSVNLYDTTEISSHRRWYYMDVHRVLWLEIPEFKVYTYTHRIAFIRVLWSISSWRRVDILMEIRFHRSSKASLNIILKHLPFRLGLWASHFAIIIVFLSSTMWNPRSSTSTAAAFSSSFSSLPVTFPKRLRLACMLYPLISTTSSTTQESRGI